MLAPIHEFRTGLLTWHFENPVMFKVTDPAHSETLVYQSPTPTTKGFTQVQIESVAQMELSVDPPEAADLPHEIRWQGFIDNYFVTLVWNDIGLTSPAVHFDGMPVGKPYQFLTLDVPDLVWWPEYVLTTPSSVIHLNLMEETRPVLEASGPEPVVAGELPSQLTTIERTVARGEIHLYASGNSPEKALQKANALLGLMAITLSDRAVGHMKSREALLARDGTLEVALSVLGPQMADPMIRPMEQVSTSDIRALYDALLVLDEPAELSATVRNAVVSALSAYRRALLSISLEDQFVSYFTGIELISHAYDLPIDEGEPKYKLSKDEEFLQCLADLQPRFADINLEKVLLGALRRRSASERFYAFALQHNVAGLIENFDVVKPIRDKIAHGSSVELTPSVVELARTTVVALFRVVLRLPEKLDWESNFRFSFLALKGQRDTSVISEVLKSVGLEPD